MLAFPTPSDYSCIGHHYVRTFRWLIILHHAVSLEICLFVCIQTWGPHRLDLGHFNTFDESKPALRRFLVYFLLNSSSLTPHRFERQQCILLRLLLSQAQFKGFLLTFFGLVLIRFDASKKCSVFLLKRKNVVEDKNFRLPELFWGIYIVTCLFHLPSRNVRDEFYVDAASLFAE